MSDRTNGCKQVGTTARRRATPTSQARKQSVCSDLSRTRPARGRYFPISLCSQDCEEVRPTQPGGSSRRRSKNKSTCRGDRCSSCYPAGQSSPESMRCDAPRISQPNAWATTVQADFDAQPRESVMSDDGHGGDDKIRHVHDAAIVTVYIQHNHGALLGRAAMRELDVASTSSDKGNTDSLIAIQGDEPCASRIGSGGVIVFMPVSVETDSNPSRNKTSPLSTRRLITKAINYGSWEQWRWCSGIHGWRRAWGTRRTRGRKYGSGHPRRNGGTGNATTSTTVGRGRHSRHWWCGCGSVTCCGQATPT